MVSVTVALACDEWLTVVGLTASLAVGVDFFTVRVFALEVLPPRVAVGAKVAVMW